MPSLENVVSLRKKVHYLGHVASKEGMTVDLEKIRVITEWETLRHMEEVRYFMGLVGYYRRFVRNFSRIAYLITSLQRQGKKFDWIEECETSFDKLKQFLTNALVLNIAYLDKEFMVCTYACKRGLGGVLMQEG